MNASLSKELFQVLAEFHKNYTFCQPVIHVNILFSVLRIQSSFLLINVLVTDRLHGLRLLTSHQFRFSSIFFSQILMKLLSLGVCQRTKFHVKSKADFDLGDGTSQYDQFYTSLNNKYRATFLSCPQSSRLFPVSVGLDIFHSVFPMLGCSQGIRDLVTCFQMRAMSC